MKRFILALAVVVAATSTLTTAGEPPAGSHPMNLAIHGIRATADRGWIEASNALAPTARTVVISFDEPEAVTPRNDALGALRPLVRNGDIIHVGNPDSPGGRAALLRIAAMPSVTVLIDQHLDGFPISVIGNNDRWRQQTQWAGTVAERLAAAHIKQYPDAQTTLVGHSAGTDAELYAQKRAEAQGGSRPIFNHSIVVSPRTQGGFTKDTLMVLEDGDFAFSPQGHITGRAAANAVGLGTINADDAHELQREGYAVVRIAHEDRAILPLSMQALEQHLPLSSSYLAHSDAHDFSYPSGTITVYAQGTDLDLTIKSGSLATVVNKLIAVRGDDVASPQKSLTYDRVALANEELLHAQPTPSIGGISLSGEVRFPFAPTAVSSARYDPTRKAFLLTMRSGSTLVLGQIDPVIARELYDEIYVANAKPEVSIGSAHFTGPDGRVLFSPHPAGRASIFYLGGIVNTRLGLIMELADNALGTLAMGSTANVREVVAKVPAFRTLGEMFPERYTEHPDLDRYMGEGRVFFHPDLTTFSKVGGQLKAQPTFTIAFPHSGPVEAAFTTFFRAHFDEIAQTRLAAPLRDLRAYTPAAGLYRWLKDNGVAFDPAGLPAPSHASFFTPQDAPSLSFPTIDEIHPAKPTILFGAFGPTRIVRADGRETRFVYQDGRPIQVQRYDSRSMTVMRDDLGRPLALRWNTGEQATFTIDARSGLVLIDGKRLTAGTRVYHETQSEEAVAQLLARFATPS